MSKWHSNGIYILNGLLTLLPVIMGSDNLSKIPYVYFNKTLTLENNVKLDLNFVLFIIYRITVVLFENIVFFKYNIIAIILHLQLGTLTTK